MMVPAGSGPAADDEASEVAWFGPNDLGDLDIHPTQWRQLQDYLDRNWPHVD
jgi:hypothetical protein